MAYSRKKFSQKQKDEFLAQGKRFWESSTRMMEPFYDIVNDCERLWRAQLPDELEGEMAEHRDRAALAPPDIYMNIKSIRAGIKKLLFSKKPYAVLTEEGNPGKKSDFLPKAEWTLQNMLDIQHEGRGFKSEADKIIHQALYAGFTATFTHWVEYSRPKPQRHPETKQLIRDKDGNPIYEQAIVASYAETIGLDIRRVRVDPAADLAHQSKINGFQSLRSLSDLIALNRSSESFYDFDEKALNKSSFNREEYYRYVSGESEQYPGKGEQNDTFGDKIVEVREIRGLFREEKPDGSISFKDMVLVYANDDLVIGIKENNLPVPGYDLFNFPAIDQELSRMFAMGLVEPMMDTWIEFFVKRNQSLDESTRRTYSTYVADKNACEDLPDIIEHYSDQVLKVDLVAAGIDDVRKIFAPLPIAQFGQDTFIQAQSLKTELRQGMGQNNYTAGLDPTTSETATGVNELVEGTNDLMLNIVEVLTDTFFSPAWRTSLILYNFFRGHEERTMQTESGDTFQIAPGEIDYFYLIDVEAKTTADRPTLQRRWVESYPLMREDPNIDPYELTKTNLEVLGIPNSTRLLKQPQKLQDDIERENISLLKGVQLFVSEFDEDQAHIEGHVEAMDQAQQAGGDANAFAQHIQEHEQQLEGKMQGSLGNTKELGGGSGNLVTGAAGAIGLKTGAGGRGLPSGSRR